LKKAFLLDFDGVIAETLPSHMYAWQQACRDENFDSHEMTVRLNEGTKAWQICMAMANHRGVEISQEKATSISDMKNQIFRSTNRAQLYPQITDLINFAKTNAIKLAIVTGTSTANLKSVISHNLFSEFDYVVADENTPNGKPAPDPFLIGAKNLGVLPKECIVVENAPLGIEAAKAAGTFCVALETTLPREHLSKADVIYKNHSELLQNIEQLLVI
jgi:beta-phosphoglucomutase